VIVIIWVVGIALLGILGYALYSSRKGADLSSDDDDEVASRVDVLAEIAALDDEFEANNIDEDEYNDQRDELKRIAMELGNNDSSREPDPAQDKQQLEEMYRRIVPIRDFEESEK
jgi:flagellar basal body-associated protein FliL